MQALQFTHAAGPAQLICQEDATPSGFDLWVAVNAVGVNPVDKKIQSTITDTPKILGWDACATVVAVGEKVSDFQPGDRVFYAGDLTRPGCFASHQLVDSRLVAHAPQQLTELQTASLPLISLTAWELLFNRLKISLQKDRGKTLLIIGGAGGVGSMLIQLAKQLAGLQVIASTGSEQSTHWCQQLGADHTVSHHGSLSKNYEDAQLPAPDYIICLANSDDYYPVMAALIKPQGLIGLAVSFHHPVDLNLLKNKSAGLVWEFMFTRSLFNTADMEQQKRILQRIAELIDAETLIHPVGREFDQLSASTLQQAHDLLNQGNQQGKIVLGPLAGGDGK
ncbi:Bifunctional protein: zinc-containing alcohol dehydrogenase, quinone oxidoreductase (NADPH:quinone reductase) [Methylophaga frappieri]|uniref:Zinc-type alcohol dehydrogenase-like protein n=1 Tax=Methylophaga frappieri (strain ATCC BAA-2434 / DSM 25690 / JAM7) TaxID=754477 RepID=I1YH73_METFJ|nr:zinc-binding alcohol dehydrogenase family protein [Methylophaga frappieri]AFJ02266.1 Bifunctional protein: zinc-containing alcohol dehydrogenase, quinone oxidoreductase (NADPH:quinone reductase) [Methylophaga frappieri]